MNCCTSIDSRNTFTNNQTDLGGPSGQTVIPLPNPPLPEGQCLAGQGLLTVNVKNETDNPVYLIAAVNGTSPDPGPSGPARVQGYFGFDNQATTSQEICNNTSYSLIVPYGNSSSAVVLDNLSFGTTNSCIDVTSNGGSGPSSMQVRFNPNC